MKGIAALLAGATAFAAMSATAAVNVEAYVKKDSFEDIKLSPTGEYYAATVPRDHPARRQQAQRRCRGRTQ
jgi:hypothetical protein